MHDLRAADAADTKTKAEWLARIDEIGEELGYFEPLGPHHSAFFMDESPTLLVTFETIQSIRGGSEGQMPLGLNIAKTQGWSHLCIIADGDTWYRDRAVYGYFDRLVDDAFFEDFDRVVFYGAGMGAYAAAAYSVTAPGATVVAVQPVATLDPEVTEWDNRFAAQRRLCFTDRYGYAPEMIDGAGEVFVLYDPDVTLDAMQAALFTRPFVTKLRCRYLGDALEPALVALDILPKVLALAGLGRLTAADFYTFFRARRNYRPYLRRLLASSDAKDTIVRSALICRNVLSRMGARYFERRQQALEVILAERNITLPPQLPQTIDAD